MRLLPFYEGSQVWLRFFAEHTKSIFAISVPVLYEIYYGFYFAPQSKKFQKDFAFLQRLKEEEKRIIQLLNDIQVFDLTLPAIKKSAEISALLDIKGLHVGKMDILIAGIILVNGHNELLTNNTSHYEHIPDLKIYSY